jgi:hypothetical protein
LVVFLVAGTIECFVGGPKKKYKTYQKVLKRELGTGFEASPAKMLCLRLLWCPELANSRPKLLQILLLLLLLLQRAQSPRLPVHGRRERESGNWWHRSRPLDSPAQMWGESWWWQDLQ